MKYLVLLFIFSFSLFANDIKKEELKQDSKKTTFTKELSKKEIAYQEYKSRLEEENKKLEEDGFCSCNNN